MPEWVKNDKIWDKAKDTFKKQYKKEPKTSKDFSIITDLYQKMGGKISSEAFKIAEGIKMTNNNYIERLDSLEKQKIKDIKSFLQIRTNSDNIVTDISLTPGMSFKQFANYFPKISKKDLVRIFDRVVDGKYKKSDLKLESFISNNYMERLDILSEEIKPGKYKTKGGETIIVHSVSGNKAVISGDDSKNKTIDLDALKGIIGKESFGESVNKDTLFIRLSSKDDVTNIQVVIDNNKNKLIVDARAYNKDTKKSTRTQFSKDTGRKLSLNQMTKIHNDINKLSSVDEVRNYILNKLQVTKESYSERLDNLME